MKSPDMRPNPGVPTEPCQAVDTGSRCLGCDVGCSQEPHGLDTHMPSTVLALAGVSGAQRNPCSEHEGDLAMSGEDSGTAELILGTLG